MDSESATVQKLRHIANNMRPIPSETSNAVNKERMAWNYMEMALSLGAFSTPQWIGLRTEIETSDFDFVSAAQWFEDNGKKLGLNVDESKRNGHIDYWIPFVADLIEAEADRLYCEEQSRLEALANAPVNRWQAFHDWWQHNLIATIVVTIVIIISAFGGLIAFYKEVAALVQGGN